jgi:sec-independent protein translocase protein TatA
MFGIGIQELVIVLVIVLVLFGGKKLPEFSRGLGIGIKEFRKGLNGNESRSKKKNDTKERKPNLILFLSSLLHSLIECNKLVSSMVSGFRKLLTKNMTRQEFLIHLGLIVITVLGISSYINQLKSIGVKSSTHKSHKHSFGSSVYGI